MRRSKEYEGWASSLQAEFGHDLVRFLEESQILDEEVATIAGARKLLGGKSPEEEPYRDRGGRRRARGADASRRSTARAASPAPTSCPAELFKHHDYRRFVEVHATLLKQVGRPPFEVKLEGPHRGGALLRRPAPGGHGPRQARRPADPLQGPRRDERRPAARDDDGPGQSRTLQRVTIEDASAADQIFSMLMGDQVEPRRDFIETYAKDVSNLDV